MSGGELGAAPTGILPFPSPGRSIPRTSFPLTPEMAMAAAPKGIEIHIEVITNTRPAVVERVPSMPASVQMAAMAVLEPAPRGISRAAKEAREVAIIMSSKLAL